MLSTTQILSGIPATFIFIALTTSPSPADEPTFSAGALWENKYISEGLNNLEHGGLFSIEGSTEINGATFGVWYAVGERETYDELNISTEYGFELGPVEAYIGYTRLEFFKDDEFDNEISAGFALNNIRWVTPAIDYTYSTAADGGFLEVSLRSEFKPCFNWLTVEPYMLETFDFGYVSKDFDGPNNLQVGIDLTAALTEKVSLVGSIAHSWALKNIERERLGDQSWASLGLFVEF